VNTRKDRDPQEIYGLPPSQELAEGLEAKAKSRETSIQYFVGVTLTVGCGAALLWLGFGNDRFAEQLFNTLLGLFAFGTGGVMTLIGQRDR
jgi:hypothetical protein